jgi:hypothetical protein
VNFSHSKNIPEIEHTQEKKNGKKNGKKKPKKKPLFLNKMARIS